MTEKADMDTRQHTDTSASMPTDLPEGSLPSGRGDRSELAASQAASTTASYHELRAGGVLLIVDATIGQRPVIVYSGLDLAGVDGAQLAALSGLQHAPGSASVHQGGSLLNEISTGITGPSGFLGHRDGFDWAPDFRVVDVSTGGADALTIHCRDDKLGIASAHFFAIDPETGILRTSSRIENLSEGVFNLDWCAALCLPLDQRFSRFQSFTGRWSGEFHIEEIDAFQGSIVRENKAGRTSHDVFPGGYLTTPATTEIAGDAMGFHLAWSGNHRLRIDRHSDNRSVMQAGEMLFPGEIRLALGEVYETPELLVAYSRGGTNAISQAFHTYLLGSVMEPRSLSKPRPVHYNTWEAVYFDHDEDELIELAKAAAEVGAERFVLDDGWFGGRRNDAAGLGDWWVSPDVYPKGLHRLVDTVKALGMEFGLWFEPEMVNPDSDLYRAHPDWVLEAKGVDQVPFRGQLTLDLTRSEVFDYLAEKISTLVSEYGIAYIKWDMNRDTSHPGSGGRAVMHQQTLAVYRLFDRLRAAHPELEIESCSSGGARADYGIMRRADRIWTSDNNDARQRQAIMRGASHFFPLRVLGNHVGPRKCHITGRELSMSLRVASAVFGHMGMELDLRDETPEDFATLKAGIALYKKHRDLIHQGTFWRLPSSDCSNFIGCVAPDRGEALFSYSKLETELATLPKRMRFVGLDPARSYRVRMVWPLVNPSISSPSIVDSADLLGEGMVFSGAALMEHGMQPPLTFPDTGMFYHLAAID
ncbi:MAG: alpha-galactosidase [Pseudomonadota bacterium]|nr:alpha-galactosidase [Pseudomonadota bacterium]